MCDWVSVVTKGTGKLYYFDAKQREQIRKGELRNPENEFGISNLVNVPDHHSTICRFFGLDDDKVNKYEFRPLDRKFIVDQINLRSDDSARVNRAMRRINYQKLAPPELTLRPIYNPLSKKGLRKRIIQKDIDLLKDWITVCNQISPENYLRSMAGNLMARDSMMDSDWNSVKDSVRDSVNRAVGYSVWNSVRDSIWDWVGHGVRDLVAYSVWYSGWYPDWHLVEDSVIDPIQAYAGSFFNLNKWEYIKHKDKKYPFQPAVDLWYRNLVPSFDGKTWRLCTGPKARIVYELEI